MENGCEIRMEFVSSYYWLTQKGSRNGGDWSVLTKDRIGQLSNGINYDPASYIT